MFTSVNGFTICSSILAETQSLVAKRLDRIEFMVLSALNEVPPQSRIGYTAAEPVPEPPTSPEPDETV